MHPIQRALMNAGGFLCVALGLIGVVVPGMPTTVFMLTALYLFARSNPRLARWIWEHPTFGPPIRRWKTHRVISREAKQAAVSTMTVSVFLLALTAPPAVTIAVGALLVVLAGWLWTRAEQPAAELSEPLTAT